MIANFVVAFLLFVASNAQNEIFCPDGGDCVDFYLCKNGTIITDGENLLDIRFEGDSCKEDDYTKVCCKPLDQLKDSNLKNKNDGPGLKLKCGHRNDKGIFFQIAGANNSEAEYGEFPWMMAVLKDDDFGYQCGGSLIHPQVVLTTAHCVLNDVSNPKAITVRSGEWDTKTENELLPSENIKVSKIIIHEDFRKANLHNDIALLVMEKPFKLDEHVDVLCLPPHNQNFDNTDCLVAGWGKDNFGNAGTRQVIMKKIELPTVPFDRCQDLLRQTRLGSRFNLHDSFMCAGEKDKDACTGDGGAPLVCPLQKGINQYYQAGIVAWGIGCKTETPGVYVNVPAFRYWIDEQMDKNGFDKSSYVP